MRFAADVPESERTALEVLRTDISEGEPGSPQPRIGDIARLVADAEAVAKVAADIGPEDARCLLEAWLAGVGIEARGRDLLEMLQADGFSHADLYRRARRRHERRLRLAVDGGLAQL